VYHEEWVNVRERLGFKPPADPDRRPSREKTINEGFSWVPPGLPSHKVSVNINWPYNTLTYADCFCTGTLTMNSSSLFIFLHVNHKAVFVVENMIKRISTFPALQHRSSVYFAVFLSVPFLLSSL
jgi:hypothetical protein